jgi:hypothetical protein
MLYHKPKRRKLRRPSKGQAKSLLKGYLGDEQPTMKSLTELSRRDETFNSFYALAPDEEIREVVREMGRVVR